MPLSPDLTHVWKLGRTTDYGSTPLHNMGKHFMCINKSYNEIAFVFMHVQAVNTGSVLLPKNGSPKSKFPLLISIASSGAKRIAELPLRTRLLHDI